jgi:hypothetical protein
VGQGDPGGKHQGRISLTTVAPKFHNLQIETEMPGSSSDRIQNVIIEYRWVDDHGERRSHITLVTSFNFDLLAEEVSLAPAGRPFGPCLIGELGCRSKKLLAIVVDQAHNPK